MRLAICDDDKKYNEQLREMLEIYLKRKRISKYEILTFYSGLYLLESYDSGLFDFVFLDLDMPGMGGFETAEHIIKLDRYVGIVFVTFAADQVYNSFKYKAKDYLCKPVSQAKIDEVMDRLLEERNFKQEKDLYSVYLKSGGTITFYLPDVLYFESDDNYVNAVSLDAVYTFKSSMKKVICDLTDNGFIRVSRTHIVNKLHVFKVFSDKVVLKTTENFSIGRKYKSAVKKAFEGVW